MIAGKGFALPMPDDTRSVLNHLIEALRDLNALVRREQVPATIIGGVAASLVGRPRMTKDVDLLVHMDDQNWAGFLQAAERAGFAPRARDPLEFAQQTRVLLLRHQASGIDIDVILGATSFENEVIQRSTVAQLHGLSIPLPTPEDLIVLKWLAHRDQDVLDVHGILDAHPNLNTAAVKSTLSSLAEYVDDFDIAAEFDALLARRKKPH